jgi:hypothetical protein
MFADPHRTSPGYQSRVRCDWTLQGAEESRLTIVNDTSLAVDINLFRGQNARFVFTPSSEREEGHILLGLFISFNYPRQRA